MLDSIFCNLSSPFSKIFKNVDLIILNYFDITFPNCWDILYIYYIFIILYIIVILKI